MPGGHPRRLASSAAGSTTSAGALARFTGSWTARIRREIRRDTGFGGLAGRDMGPKGASNGTEQGFQDFESVPRPLGNFLISEVIKPPHAEKVAEMV